MSQYRNRVLGWAEVPADQLMAHPDNWRIHSHHQQNAVEALVDQVGWVSPIIVNGNTGHVVDGHLRVLIALEKNEQEPLPVVYVDLEDDEERLMLASLDPTAQLAVTDKNKLAVLLLEMDNRSDTITGLMHTIAKRNKVSLRTEDGTPNPSIEIEPRLCVCAECGKVHYKTTGESKS